MSDEVRAAIEELKEAEAAVALRVKVINDEIQAATDDVRARHHDELTALRKAREGATRAVWEARNRLPDHPWTGKRVYKYEYAGDRWHREKVRIYGIVEMRRLDTRFPDNVSAYRMPEVGEPFVRSIRKNGDPGLKFWKLLTWEGDIDKDWKEAEEETTDAE